MKNFFKNRIISFFVFIILFAASSPLILSSVIPSNVTVTKSEKENLWIPAAMRWVLSTKRSEATPAMESSAKKLDTDSYSSTVYFCGLFPIKDVEITIVEDKIVTLGGNAIGINLKTDGVLVVKIEKVKADNGKNISPGEDAGLRCGDLIERINGININKKEDVSAIAQKSKGTLLIEGKRNGKEIKCTLNTVKNENGEHILGIWVRDTVAGIGTVTFYSDGKFAALGHPICDIDTGQFVTASGGSVFSAGIVGVDRGSRGIPGSLKGIFTSNKTGTIVSNSQFGVFGTSEPPESERVVVAKKEEIRCREAQIVCDIGNGPEKFDIEIQRIMPESDTSKSMVIHITDKTLLEKTGGIVQGMSGSPILQNGKLVGAVTHVFVNDPTRGYGIFIENMLAEAEKIK